MPKNITIKGAREEELMEAKSFYDNFVEDLDKTIALIDKNEEGDHANDKTRTEVITDLLSALRSIQCKDMNATDNFIHGALQKINNQEKLDLQDDKPRIEARIKLAEIRQKAICSSDNITKLIERCGKKNKHQ